MGIVMIVQGEADLPEIVGASQPARRFAHALHGRHQQAHQDRDDGDDHQQLDERKAGARPARVGVTWLHAAFQVWAGDMGENAMAK
jgi:hypothetical protein